MASLKDISIRCGVSVATVSKALNNHNDISVATKQKILKTAKELGYFPNSQARALKTNRTHNLGVMYLDDANSGFTHEFFARILNSFKIEAENSGYDITFINKNIGGRQMSTYEHCRYRNVDGVLIACTNFSDPDVYEVINGDIPVVTIDHIFECRSAILSDNNAGISKLVEYVYSKGHRKLAYIQGNKSAVSERRLAGYHKTCTSLGIEMVPENITSAEYHNIEITYEITKKILRSANPPTCIFMPDDYSAIGGYNAIRDMGLQIPYDISVVGYDGMSYTQLLNPTLTTYKQNVIGLGTLAAKQLIQHIENPNSTFNEVQTVEGDFIEAESVATII